MRLENQVTRDGIIFLHHIERDLVNKQLEFAFYGSTWSDNRHCTYPDESRIVRFLTFTQVENFTEIWDEPEDPDYIEQIIGIHEEPEGDAVSYWVRLDQSEMHFVSQALPQIVEMNIAPEVLQSKVKSLPRQEMKHDPE